MAKLEKKETIQAVVMANNFNDNFKPFNSFNSDVKKYFSYLNFFCYYALNSQALLPLVNVPLISYVLETLNRNGVEEVWIFCTTFVEKIKEFIKYAIFLKLAKMTGKFEAT